MEPVLIEVIQRIKAGMVMSVLTILAARPTVSTNPSEAIPLCLADIRLAKTAMPASPDTDMAAPIG